MVAVRRFRWLAVAVCLLAPILGAVGASAQGGGGVALGEVLSRNELIAAQESLLNVYRCRFDVDTEIVPGGCVDGQPGGGPTQPGPFEGTPTANDVAVRDSLIQAQESLLNTYRCLFKIDTEIVPGGCNRIAVPIRNSIWVMDGDGEDAKQIVTRDQFAVPDASPYLSSPVWSPHGTRLAFVVNYHEEPWDGMSDRSEIWSVNGDGTGLRNLTGSGTPAFENIFELSWSPDGARLAFRSFCCDRQRHDARSDLRIMDADGANGVELAKVSGQRAYSWSPDGSRIAYSIGPTNDVRVANADGTNQRRLAFIDADYGPVWSPDGGRIAVGVASSAENRKEIWVFGADGSNRRRIATSDYEFGSPRQRGELGFSWSPDGAQIAYFDVQGADLILTVIGADGSNKRQIATLEGTPSPPNWSPDGTRIAYSTGNTTVTQNGTTSIALALWVAFADGTKQQQIASGPVYAHYLSWTP